MNVNKTLADVLCAQAFTGDKKVRTVRKWPGEVRTEVLAKLPTRYNFKILVEGLSIIPGYANGQSQNGACLQR